MHQSRTCNLPSPLTQPNEAALGRNHARARPSAAGRAPRTSRPAHPGPPQRAETRPRRARPLPVLHLLVRQRQPARLQHDRHERMPGTRSSATHDNLPYHAPQRTQQAAGRAARRAAARTRPARRRARRTWPRSPAATTCSPGPGRRTGAPAPRTPRAFAHCSLTLAGARAGPPCHSNRRQPGGSAGQCGAGVAPSAGPGRRWSGPRTGCTSARPRRSAGSPGSRTCAPAAAASAPAHAARMSRAPLGPLKRTAPHTTWPTEKQCTTRGTATSRAPPARRPGAQGGAGGRRARTTSSTPAGPARAAAGRRRRAATSRRRAAPRWQCPWSATRPRWRTRALRAAARAGQPARRQGARRARRL